jgi:hypothetical protein
MRATLRGLIAGIILGAAVILLLLWGGGDLDSWQSRLGSITLTILLFAFAGGNRGAFHGAKIELKRHRSRCRTTAKRLAALTSSSPCLSTYSRPASHRLAAGR